VVIPCLSGQVPANNPCSSFGAGNFRCPTLGAGPVCRAASFDKASAGISGAPNPSFYRALHHY